MNGKLLALLKKYNILILFFFFQLVALFSTFQHSVLHRAYISDWWGDWIYQIEDFKHRIGTYVHLKEQNQILQKENVSLYERLFYEKKEETQKKGQYAITESEVIKVTLSNARNYLLIKHGFKDGIKLNMGVFSPKGMVGIIKKVSENYCLAVSLFNQSIKYPARHKKSNHLGFISWNGKNNTTLQLEDIPKYADIQTGDTIVTDASSHIFPHGIPLGKVVRRELIKHANHYKIDIKPFVDYPTLETVYIIQNKDKIELDHLIDSYL